MKKPVYYIAAQWPIEDYPAKKPWTPEQRLENIQKEGFDGVTADMDSKLFSLAHKAGLITVGNLDIGKKSVIKERFSKLHDLGAVHVNVQLCDHDTPTEKALPIAIAVIEEGRKYGLLPLIEFHRDTCTETPEKGYALAAAYQKATGERLPMNFDFSHLAIVKQIPPRDFTKRLLDHPKLVAPTTMLHLRPFNGSHCQIPITNGRGGLSPEFKDWLPFCEDLMKLWFNDKNWNTYRVIVPEQGPVRSGYGLSCFPDVWKDILVLTKELKKVWKKVSTETAAPVKKAKR
ncbi:MAG: xylose isomerase [Chthoniobacterales bacterium]